LQSRKDVEGRKRMILSVVNQKRGVGQTPGVTPLAVCFAADKKDVLLIDADSQRSARVAKSSYDK
jgi:cellulose biosynthesis protein BcsQ